MPYFDRVLVANRGEIALRVIRACREMGIATVAVYSDVDADAPHARAADQAVLIGPAPARDSYLSIPAIIAAAQATGASAIHPGYGFLAENAEFAEACAAAGLSFIGPPPAAIRLMGSKTAAKATAERAGVPTVPGYQGDDQAPATMLRAAQRIGFPVMIKAAAGGGGKGMRAVAAKSEFPDALAAAQREALAAFGDATVFLEKLIERPRHIEFQIIADQFGTGLHLGERECSIQRRHQKVLEEAPSAAVSPELRATMGEAAVRAALAAGYVNAGTVEFLLDDDGRYYFLEMNTRLQVEHPVTEQVTGLDLVQLQLAVAAGERLGAGGLGLRQDAIPPRGHAIEVRLYAEDPATYLPATGPLLVFDPPRGPGIRLDAGVTAGDTVTMHYDPLLAKLIVAAPDRPAALRRMAAALDDFGVLGITTNLPLLRYILADARFARGETHTDFLTDPRYAAPPADPPDVPDAVLALAAALTVRDGSAATQVRRSPWSAGALRSGEFTARFAQAGATQTVVVREVAGAVRAWVDAVPVSLPGAPDDAPIVAARHAASGAMLLRQGTIQLRLWTVADGAPGGALVTAGGRTLRFAPLAPPDVATAARDASQAGGGAAVVAAPMAGTIIQVRVRAGEQVVARQTLVVLGAMKMEHNLTAPGPGVVRRVMAREGAVVAGGVALVELDPV